MVVASCKILNHSNIGCTTWERNPYRHNWGLRRRKKTDNNHHHSWSSETVSAYVCYIDRGEEEIGKEMWLTSKKRIYRTLKITALQQQHLRSVFVQTQCAEELRECADWVVKHKQTNKKPFKWSPLWLSVRMWQYFLLSPFECEEDKAEPSWERKKSRKKRIGKNLSLT